MSEEGSGDLERVKVRVGVVAPSWPPSEASSPYL